MKMNLFPLQADHLRYCDIVTDASPLGEMESVLAYEAVRIETVTQ